MQLKIKFILITRERERRKEERGRRRERRGRENGTDIVRRKKKEIHIL